MPTEIVCVPRREIQDIQTQIQAVYRAAFALPPYQKGPAEVARFVQVFDRHVERVGFRCFVARESNSARILGFVYGYTSAPGQWWHDAVAAALRPAMVERWLTDCFELVELAVLPEMQGQGIGRRLHDALLTGLPHRTAVLSTLDMETAGLRLYRQRGWAPLLRDFIFPGGKLPYLIMGRDLPLPKL